MSDPKSPNQESYSKITDWVESQYSGIEFSKSANMFYCKTHDKILRKGPLVQHLKAHGIKPASNPKLNQKLNELSADNESDDELGLVPTPAQMILEDNNKQIAEAAGMLAKDYELRAQYEMMTQQKLIPWDWSFYDWLKGCVIFWNKKWGYDLVLSQDVSILDKDQKDWLRTTIQENLIHENAQEQD